MIIEPFSVCWRLILFVASDPVFTLVYTVCVNRGVNRQKAMDATISVICFKSKTLANGEHPLMLRITKDRKRNYIQQVSRLCE